ncbi:MAG: XisI protein [Anaerolineae bacterium]|nr:XisI protein [Anaerolineae bacterium]
MATLAETLKEAMVWYTSGGFDLEAYLLSNDVKQVYSVNIVSTAYPKPQWPADVVVMARIMGDYVIIEDDRTDKPLVKRLLAAGIPREKIILAYANEPLPDLA